MFSKETFETLLPVFPYQTSFPMIMRKSDKGVHGLDGDEHVFEARFEIGGFGKKWKFYIKRYFWPKGTTQGVTIQSFRFN